MPLLEQSPDPSMVPGRAGFVSNCFFHLQQGKRAESGKLAAKMSCGIGCVGTEAALPAGGSLYCRQGLWGPGSL